MLTSLLVCIGVYGVLGMSLPARRFLTRATRARSARLLGPAA